MERQTTLGDHVTQFSCVQDVGLQQQARHGTLCMEHWTTAEPWTPDRHRGPVVYDPSENCEWIYSRTSQTRAVVSVGLQKVKVNTSERSRHVQCTQECYKSLLICRCHYVRQNTQHRRLFECLFCVKPTKNVAVSQPRRCWRGFKFIPLPPLSLPII